jgi:hypothetical protein
MHFMEIVALKNKESITIAHSEFVSAKWPLSKTLKPMVSLNAPIK